MLTKKTLIFNPIVLFLSIWIFSLFLYSIQLSQLIKFNYFFVILVLSFILLFVLLNHIFIKKFYLRIKIYNIRNSILKNKKIYYITTYLFFMIGSIGFIIEVTLYSDFIPIFLQNKINSGTPNHHIHYITQFSMYSSLLSILLYFLLKRKQFLIIYFFSIVELLIWMKRGEILPPLFALMIAYYIKQAEVNNLKKFYFILFIVITIFIILFSVIGNLRMEYVLEHIYKQTFNEKYLMQSWVPSAFGWVYIYIATTLENARHIILEQQLTHYTYGTQLVYPFLAPFAKDILGASYYAELLDGYGLAVVSFIGDAYSDFSYIGVYIYTFIYFLLGSIAYFFINRGLFGVALFVLGEMFMIWSIFSNSIQNGVFIIGFIIFLLLSIKFENKNYRKFSNNKEKVNEHINYIS